MISLAIAFLTWHFFFRKESLRQQLPWILSSLAIEILMFVFSSSIHGFSVGYLASPILLIFFFMSIWAFWHLIDIYKTEDEHDLLKIYPITAFLGAYLQTIWVVLTVMLTSPYFWG